VKLTTHLYLDPGSKNVWSYNSTPQYAFMASCTVKITGTTLPLPSPNIIRVIKPKHTRWVEHVKRMGETRNAYRILVGYLEGNMLLGKRRRRKGDNIKMYLS
jgi:hypothetical protein